MPTRRDVLGFILALPVIARTRRAAAGTLAPGSVYDGDFVSSVWRGNQRFDGDAPPGRTMVALASGDRAALRRPVGAHGRAIDAWTNANDEYLIELELAGEVRGEAWIIDTSGTAIRSRGTSQAGNKTTTYFIVDRALADVLAASWKLPRRDRSVRGEGVIGHWSVKRPDVKLGDPIEIDVEIENVGNYPATITFGPLASSFAFAVTRDRIALPAIPLDYTGPMGLRTLAPGTGFTLTADLRPFAKIDRPGTYDVACTFTAEGISGPTFATRISEGWDIPLTGTVRVVVR